MVGVEFGNFNLEPYGGADDQVEYIVELLQKRDQSDFQQRPMWKD